MEDVSNAFGDAADMTKAAGDVTKAAGNLSKNLPGMMGQSGGDKEGADAPEPKICETCNQPVVICPTCHQKVVDSQPAGTLDSINKGLDTANNAFDCCNKMFDCFGKAEELGQQ